MTYDVEVTTNHHRRDLLGGWELTENERSELDYVENLDLAVDRFFRYRGQVYDLREFQRLDPDRVPAHRAFPAGWHAYQPQSYFHGLVVRHPYEDGERDWERIIVGSYVVT